MIPFSNQDGLRDYRAPARTEVSRHGWIWLALLVVLVVLIDVVLAHGFRLSAGH